MVTQTRPGFSAIMAAGEQGRWPPAVLRDQAHGWGRELANQPIGCYLRELGHRPGPTADEVTAFVRGIDDARVVRRAVLRVLAVNAQRGLVSS